MVYGKYLVMAWVVENCVLTRNGDEVYVWKNH